MTEAEPARGQSSGTHLWTGCRGQAGITQQKEIKHMIQRSMAKKRSGEGGFTLVELLIVIVILGILAAIVVLAIGGLKDSASNANCDAGVKTLSSAEDAYFAQNGQYTTDAILLNPAHLIKKAPANLTATPSGGGAGYVIAGSGDCAGHGETYP
jgi:prepilin-type N-terminal cleavage/methylation domain-containing protein